MHISGTAPTVQNSDEEEDGDRQMDADDSRDFLEQDILPPQHAPATGPYARFLANISDWMNMTQEEYNKSWEALPLPAVGHAPPGILLERAIAVSNHMLMHALNYIWSHIGPDIYTVHIG